MEMLLEGSAVVAQPQSCHYSPAEYLDQEVTADIRHEYINGDIVPMTGDTPDHNQILLNLAGALNLSLVQEPYRVFAAAQRLWIPQAKSTPIPTLWSCRVPWSIRYRQSICRNTPSICAYQESTCRKPQSDRVARSPSRFCR